MENAFQISIRAHDGISWLYERPIVLIILALIVLTIVLAVRGITKNKEAEDDFEGDHPVTGEGSERNPLISLPFSILMFILFVWAWYEAMRGHDVGIEYEPEPWPDSVMQFPLVAAIPGAVLTFLIIIKDGQDYMTKLREHGGFSAAWAHASESAVLNRAVLFFGYLMAMILIMLVVGQKLALPLFVFTYLIRWGKYSPRLALGYAVGSWVFLVGFYDQIMHLFWYPSWLDGWLPELLPAWLPSWLFV